MNTRIEEAKKRVKDMRTFEHTCDRCDNLIVCKGNHRTVPTTYKCGVEGKTIIKPTDEQCLKFCCRNYRRDV